MSGLALSAPYSVASMLAVPVAGPVLLAAMPGLRPIGSLCPGKGCDKAIETSREHISLPAPGLRPLDTLHNGYKKGGEFLRFPWARLESQRLQVVGDSCTFSPTHGTLAENDELWEGREGWTIKWGKY